MSLEGFDLASKSDSKASWAWMFAIGFLVFYWLSSPGEKGRR